MIGDHHGRAAGTATLLLTATDGILGTHNTSAPGLPLEWRGSLHTCGMQRNLCEWFGAGAVDTVGSMSRNRAQICIRSGQKLSIWVKAR
jgi:hypothetical protein